MSSTATVLAPVSVRRRTWRSVIWMVALVALCVAPFLVGVLIPYYVNGLDAVTLGELTSGAHDPKDLWPQGTVGGLMQLAGVLGPGLTPMALIGLAALGGTAVVQEWITFGVERRAPRPVAVAFVLVTAVCLALLAWFATPLAGALVTWRLD